MQRSIGREGGWAWALPAALAATALLSYVGALGFPLVFDDVMIGALSFDSLAFGPRWLSKASFVATSALLGVDVPVLRVQNVLLHAATAVAVFYLCRALIARAAPWAATGAAAAAALGFALHPVTVYGVAYLAQRSTVMATLFSVLCLYAWLRGRLQGDARWLAAAVAFYALALLSKEHAIMLPAVAVALTMAVRDQVRGTNRQLFAAQAAMVLVALWTVWSLRSLVGSVYEPYLEQTIAAAPAAAEQLQARSIVTQMGLFYRYVATWLLPLPQWMSIDVRVDLIASLLSPAAVAAVIGFLAWGGVGAWLLVAPGGRPLLGLAMLVPWLFYFTEFAAVKGQEPFVLYRSYLWGIGFPIFLAGALWPLPRRVLVAAVLVSSTLSIYGVRDRLETFATPVALWTDAIEKLGDDRVYMADRPYGNRGVALMRVGRYPEALRDLDRAIALNPRNAQALSTRASLYVATGHIERGKADFAAAIAARPWFPEALAARCGVRIATGDLAGAREDCEKAASQSRANPTVHLNLGVIAFRSGNLHRAAAEFDYVLQLEPNNVIARLNRGVLNARLGRPERARADLEAACLGGVQLACGRS